MLSWPGVIGKNSSNNVFIDLGVERQPALLRDSRTAPVGIPLLHFHDRMDEFWARSFRARLRLAEAHVRLLSESLRLAKEHASTATLDEDFARDLEAAIKSHGEPLNPPAWD